MSDRSGDSRTNGLASGATGFVIGALVGAAIALLVAPAAGADTRRRIGDTARKLREGARDQFGRGRGMMDELKEDARAAVDAGRDAVRSSRAARETRPGSFSDVGPA